jgi:hypothetical protein
MDTQPVSVRVGSTTRSNSSRNSTAFPRTRFKPDEKVNGQEHLLDNQYDSRAHEIETPKSGIDCSVRFDVGYMRGMATPVRGPDQNQAPDTIAH